METEINLLGIESGMAKAAAKSEEEKKEAALKDTASSAADLASTVIRKAEKATRKDWSPKLNKGYNYKLMMKRYKQMAKADAKRKPAGDSVEAKWG